MGKRRNRQPDVVDDGSEDSSESGEKRNTGGNCPHVAKAINLSKYFSTLKKNGISTECGTCKKLGLHEDPPDEEGFSTMPPALWICLRCAHQACGRSQKSHAEQHFKTPRSDLHCLAVDTQRWSIWCYQCEIEVNADCRKRLFKMIEFSKQLASSSTPAHHQPIPLPSAQMENKIEKSGNVDKLKAKIPVEGLTRVVGLSNLGNTCFFNAVLQCLNQTPFLVKVLEDLQEPGEKFVLPGGKWKSSDDAEEVELPPIEGTLEGFMEAKGPSFTAVLCKTLKSMQSMKTNQTFTPQELLSTFKKKTMQCMDGGQHDSHELLRHLLELVRNEDLRRYQKIILKKECGTSKVNEDSVDDTVKSNVKFYGRQANARLLGPDFVFRGVLVSTLECLECHHSSQRTEPFLDLSLPVMADKPQPPVLLYHRRKNSALDVSFDSMGESVDSMGNNIAFEQSKQQWKKEQKSAEKPRRVVKKRARDVAGNNYNQSATVGFSLSDNANSISEENSAGALQLESDADVEDNISAPEIVESGYSSEKVSTVASPVSPVDSNVPNNPMIQTDLNNTLMNGNVPVSPPESSNTPPKLPNEADELLFAELDRILVAKNLNEISMHNSDMTWPESPNGDRIDDSGDLIGVSPTNSLIVNSELSPEAPTVSPLSSSITSKESPTSPPSSATDAEIMQAEMNEIRFLIENPSSKVEHADMDSLDYQSPQNQEDLSPSSKSVELSPTKSENGVADVTVGLSKVAVTSSHSQPTRYHTKDGDCSIQSCLNQFTALELMSGSNKVGCEACTTRENKDKEGPTKMVCTQSTKQYLISRVPSILILHLKRFQSQRMGFRKLTKHVSFPMLLDLAPVCKGGGKPKIYSLYGVVVHSGCLHGGHYVAYIKTRPPLTPDDPRWAFLPSKESKESADDSSASSSDSEAGEPKSPLTAQPPPGRWYYASDSRVTEVDEATVLESQAYILFYERIL